MDLKGQILTENSKWNVDYITKEIGNDAETFRLLWSFLNTQAPPLSTRSAWVLESLSQKYPNLIEPYLKEIIERLPAVNNDTIKRHLVKILSFSILPEEYLGKLFDICLGFIESTKETVAVKVHSMQILYNISELEPELKPELIAIIENQSEKSSSGFKARGIMLLDKLIKETGSNEY